MNPTTEYKSVAPWLILALAMVSLGAGAQAVHKDIPPEQLEFFEKNIRPVLVGKCYDCHSEEKGKNKGELTLDTRDGIRAGGTRGPAVVPGKPDDSILVQAIRQTGQLRMPPDSRGGMLPDDVIANFEKWVKDGAADPRDSAKIASVQKAKPEKPIDWAKEREFWAFQKPQAATPPKVADQQWPESDVDRFVLAKLEEKGLKPVSDADKRTLLRRAYYDITGLPPSAAAVEAFVKDKSPDAFAKIVDQLLASPQFGEQWGRYWLDVARYGESTGLDRNLNYPYAWRYRNYVIDSFNDDKPYNRFILEQLAGDQLPYTNQLERDENLTATGFLAIGPKGLNEGRVNYSKWQVVGDQVDATTRGFIGLTVSCAQCHDHKFDPIPQRDYHALAGIFKSTETLYGTVGGRGNRRPTSLVSLDNAPELAVLSTGEPTPNMFVNTNRNFDVAGDAGNTNRLRRLGNGFGGTNGFGGRRFARNFTTNQLERIPAHKPYAMGVRDYDEPEDSPVYYRGDLTKPMDTVPRGFLRIVALSNPPVIPPDESGRLQLAEWITDPENPLTARVAVNRVWQHLFGAGIVATPDNLGHLGARPTDQALLDFLAVQFVTQDHWSIKQLVRSLVLTRAYQLSSDLDPKAAEADPEDTLVWRAAPRRLTAEQLRDSILTASGRLDLERPQYSVTAEFGDGYYGVNIWENDLPQHYFNRSVYLPVPRDMVPDALSLFDLPNPNLVGALREQTTSPSQALYLLNNAFVEDEALNLARRLEKDRSLSERNRIRQAYLTVFQRLPTSDEVKQARNFLHSETALLAAQAPDRTEPRYSSPELDAEATAQTAALTTARTEPAATTAVIPAVLSTTPPPVTTAADTNSATAMTAAGGGGGGGYRGGFGFRQRRYTGPGSASDVVVGKLAPGIARPAVFHQALPEKPATPEEGALALFNQALFGSAEFRYLQ